MTVRRTHVDEVVSEGGMVVAPDEHVAEAGAAVLRKGGNAVDAAVAAAFACGVVEPYMSGLGGSTTMTLGLRDPDRLVVVEGHMVSPLEATPEQYPLADTEPEGGWPVSFYDWPKVVGFANIVGAKSVAVPGSVACLCAAHEQFGRLDLATVVEPAVTLAADGFPISWFTATVIANDARSLSRDEGCASLFLRRGLPLRGPGVELPDRLVQPDLARTLGVIGREGPTAFYEGAIGRSLVETVRARGGLLSSEDLARYRPVVTAPLEARYASATLAGPRVSGFPSVVQVLRTRAAARALDASEHDAVSWARALRLAFDDRFRYMSADPAVDVPWEALRSSDYARAVVEADRAGSARPDPEGDFQVSITSSPGASGHTTQLTAVDADGNLVSLTQTVLNTFGARLLDPGTGILLNDGMAYFDTTPGSRNGIRPGVPVLSAMSPLVVCDDRGPYAAFGASGGRRIISGVAQMASALVDRRCSMQDAVEEPRIHAETKTVLLDVRWPDDARQALDDAGYEVEDTREEPTTVHFARPNGILIGSDGQRRSGLDPNKPGGVAVA